MHPELKNNGWHVIKVNYPPSSKEETRMSIGKFKDGMYHVMGYTPDSIRPYITEREESLGDFEVVSLPKGKRRLSDLVQGEVFSFAPPDHKSEPDQARFLKFN